MYKYIKGSEEDFEGAPEWCMEVVQSTTVCGRGFVDSLDYMCRYQNASYSYDKVSITNPTLWKVIAHRQLITEPAWDGVGLPPVGCECEYVGSDTSWGVVRVIGYDGEKIVFRPGGDDYYGIAPSNKCEFRPLRSEAEKKRDEAIKGIDYWLPERTADTPSLDNAIKIYDAIAAGKITGVKLED